jgi:hypothetical protein
MSAAGLVLMLVSWGGILLLALWCFKKIFSKKEIT